MPLSVEYGDLFLATELLERQCEHIHKMRLFLRQWCDFFSEGETAGLLLMALYPINKMVVDAGDSVLGLLEDTHRGTANHMNQTVETYIEVDEQINKAISNLIESLLGTPIPFNNPRDSKPKLGEAERGASQWYGGDQHIRLYENAEGLVELAEYVGIQTSYLDQRTRKALSSNRSIVEAQDASSYLVAPEAPDSEMENLRWSAGIIIGSVDWLIELLIGKSLLNDYLYKYIVGDWRTIDQASTAWYEIGDALIAVGQNDSEILPALSEWTGKGSEAANAFIAALAGITTLLQSATGLASSLLGYVRTATRLVAGQVASQLRDLELSCLALVAAGSVPVAGWVMAAADVLITVEKIYKFINLLYTGYNFIFDTIEETIRAHGQINEIRLTMANIVEAAARGVAARV